MTTKTKPKLSGNRCRCGACNLTFNSVAAFDAHRGGTYSPPSRYCRSPEQMRARGYEPDENDVWRKPLPKAALARRLAE